MCAKNKKHTQKKLCVTVDDELDAFSVFCSVMKLNESAPFDPLLHNIRLINNFSKKEFEKQTMPKLYRRSVWQDGPTAFNLNAIIDDLEYINFNTMGYQDYKLSKNHIFKSKLRSRYYSYQSNVTQIQTPQSTIANQNSYVSYFQITHTHTQTNTNTQNKTQIMKPCNHILCCVCVCVCVCMCVLRFQQCIYACMCVCISWVCMPWLCFFLSVHLACSNPFLHQAIQVFKGTYSVKKKHGTT